MGALFFDLLLELPSAHNFGTTSRVHIMRIKPKGSYDAQEFW